MINNVEFEKSNSIIVISKSEDDLGMKFAEDILNSVNNLSLSDISFTCERITFKNLSTEGNIYVNFNQRILVKNGSIVMSDCSKLIEHNILNIK